MNFQIGQIFENSYPPEAALWCHDNSAFIEALDNDKFQIKAVSKPNLQQAKGAKLAELKAYHAAQQGSSKITSLLGFEIDANDKAATDLQGLSSLMSTTGTASIDNFRDATNTLQTVTTAQVNTMEAEVQRNEQVLRAKKQAVTNLINAKQTADEVAAIDIVAEYAKPVTVSFPEITQDMQPKTGSGIDVKTDGAKIARALEWVGGTGQALSAGAIQGLNKADYGTSEQAVTMLGAGFKSYVHEFTGTGDIVQTMPNIANEDDSFVLLVRNNKASGTVALNVGGDQDTIDGKSSYVLKPNHGVLMMSIKTKSRWVVLNETELNINNKPVYIESATSVKIPTTSSRVVVAYQDGTQGTIVQTLPNLGDVQLGTTLQIRNLRTDGGTVELIPYMGQQVTSASSYTVDPQTDVFLLAEGDDWFLWFAEDLSKGGNQVQVSGSNIGTIVAQSPVQLKVNKDINQLSIGVDPVALTKKDDVGVYYSLSRSEEVVGNGKKTLHAGKVLCSEPIVSSVTFLPISLPYKAYTLQEFDDKDPNTGGQLFYVEAKFVFEGNAPESMVINCRLWKHAQGTDQEDNILTDYQGRLMSVHKAYKQGEVLGTITVKGFIVAKQVELIGMQVSHNATSDNIMLAGRAENGTCILIQAISDNNKTGLAMLAFNQDHDTKILFDKRYIGEYVASLNYYLFKDYPETAGTARSGILQADGWVFDNLATMKLGVANKTLTIQDDGVNIADFAFGNTFSELLTKDLHGKAVDVDLQLSNPDNAFNLVMLKYTGQGKPTGERIASRTNTAINWATGWEIVDTKFIAEQPDNEFYGVSHSFTVPDDAKQVCFAIVPVEAQQPMLLKIRQFDVNVAEPFYALELLPQKDDTITEDEYAQFELDKPSGDSSIRYTVNDAYAPCPIGRLKTGKAEITVDGSLNTITGSQVPNDSGVFAFVNDAQAVMTIEAQFANEQETNDVIDFALFDFTTGSAVEIPDTQVSCVVKAKSAPAVKTLQPILFTAKAGDKIGLKFKSNKQDGVYLQTDGNDPLIKVNIQTLANVNP